MLAYSALLLLLVFGVFHYDFKENKFFKGIYYFIILVTGILVTGLRYRVGGDALSYEDYFSYLPDLDHYWHYITKKNYEGYQPGWLLFVAFCKSINPDYYYYQFLHSVVFNSVFFWFFWKHSQKPFTCILICYFFLLYFYFGFEIQREMFGICCSLIAYNFFLKNKWIPYYILCTLAFAFHISAVFLFLLPFFKLVKFTNRILVISLLISLPLLFGKVYFIDFLKILLITESMQKKGEGYSEMEFSVLGILFFYFVRVVVFIPFLYSYAKNKIEDKYDWLILGLFWIAILSQVMVGFDRLNNYLYLPFVLYLADFLYNKKYILRSSFYKNVATISACLFLFSIIQVKFFVGNVDNKYFYYSVYFPYESILDKTRTPARERFMVEYWSQ
ncbi:EpsG family protein [Chryseobacterium nematophagum]|uniref:EpsG family protein n=1 Tax=Chryseobacterium nematophagum TaxID=2305228 RepID=A0A3M7LCS1_9FLAO|nr:EpsG family protein [Chryseobacterium nematophagum]RMZ59322.1 EpsG family protein [Chryseobacterium nematophagum]